MIEVITYRRVYFNQSWHFSLSILFFYEALNNVIASWAVLLQGFLQRVNLIKYSSRIKP